MQFFCRHRLVANSKNPIGMIHFPKSTSEDRYIFKLVKFITEAKYIEHRKIEMAIDTEWKTTTAAAAAAEVVRSHKSFSDCLSPNNFRPELLPHRSKSSAFPFSLDRCLSINYLQTWNWILNLDFWVLICWLKFQTRNSPKLTLIRKLAQNF